MEKIKIRSEYNYQAKWGVITISCIKDKKPVEYALTLGNPEGTITTTRNKFSNMETAIAESTNYGFLPHKWETQEQDI
jgi:hypothetical protein